MNSANIKLFIVPIFLLKSLCCFTQNNMPVNLREAAVALNNHCSEKQKKYIIHSTEDNLQDILINYDDVWKLTRTWLQNEQSLQSYFAVNSISNSELKENAILTAFRQFLLENAIDEWNIMCRYRILEQRWNYEDMYRSEVDTLRGVYIPVDLNDCFKQIDILWGDSTKKATAKMAEKKFIAESYFGFGLWLRNYWGLRNHSRLAKYFNSLGELNADHISSIILSNYHRHLRGKKSNFPVYN